MGKGEGVSIPVGCGHVHETMEDPSLVVVVGLSFHIHLYSLVFSKLISLFSSPQLTPSRARLGYLKISNF